MKKKLFFYFFEKLAEGIWSFDLVGLFECLLNGKAKKRPAFYSTAQWKRLQKVKSLKKSIFSFFVDAKPRYRVLGLVALWSYYFVADYRFDKILPKYFTI